MLTALKKLLNPSESLHFESHSNFKLSLQVSATLIFLGIADGGKHNLIQASLGSRFLQLYCHCLVSHAALAFLTQKGIIGNQC